jgi:hypothetical protein
MVVFKILLSQWESLPIILQQKKKQKAQSGSGGLQA